ncbi:MAG: hypothetical protein HYR88_00405 [Verrucomicrobia bacterium]|nr:hypothetical protein [Verrucomicrobiota bacterium]
MGTTAALPVSAGALGAKGSPGTNQHDGNAGVAGKGALYNATTKTWTNW